MDLIVLHNLHTLILPQVGIKDSYSQEVSPSCALEGGSDLDHPVDHLGPVILGHIVLVEWARQSLVLNTEVLVDLFVEGQLMIFSLVRS